MMISPVSLALAAALLSICSITSYGQCDDDQVAEWFAAPMLTDSTYDPVYAVDSNNIYAAWQFEQAYDSLITLYTITEIRRNATRLKLLSWCRGREIRDWSDTTLADSSRTEPFTVYTGDTINFFRRFSWYHAGTMESLPANYRATDTLDFAVILENATTGARIAVLDSMGVLARPTPGTPTLYGSRPIGTVAKIGIPSTLNGATVRLRVLPYSRGTGDYYFQRQDRWGINESAILSSPPWQTYLAYFNGGMGKGVAIEPLSAVSNARLDIAVRGTTIDIRYALTNKELMESPASVMIYSGAGELVFIPSYAQRTTEGEHATWYRVEASGTYVIVLNVAGRIVASKTVVVEK